MKKPLQKEKSSHEFLWQARKTLSIFKGYPHYKSIFCLKVVLDVYLMKFFIWRENDVPFPKCLDLRVFVKFVYVNIKIKFSQILVNLITNIFNMFWLNARDWKLVSGPFMILIKWQYDEIWQFLVVDIYHYWILSYSPFQKIKHLKLEILGSWILEQVPKLKRVCKLALPLQIVQKIWEKYYPCLYLSIDQVDWAIGNPVIMTSQIW